MNGNIHLLFCRLFKTFNILTALLLYYDYIYTYQFSRQKPIWWMFLLKRKLFVKLVLKPSVTMSKETLSMIVEGKHHKGDVFATARIAGIQAAKRTWELIPLCHPLLLSKVEVNLEPLLETNQVRIQSLCKLTGKTGVEMEALTAASVAALTIYDMCKAVQKDIVIEHVRLLEKSGGKSGHFIAEEK